MKAQHKPGFSLSSCHSVLWTTGCTASSKKIVKYYKRDTWKNTDVVFLAPACLPDPPTYTHHCPGSSLSPFFPQKQLPSAAGMPAILSGSSAPLLLLSHVRMCHSTELCRYMLGVVFSGSVPGVHTNGLRTKQGDLGTSLPGPLRRSYPFYKCWPTLIL